MNLWPRILYEATRRTWHTHRRFKITLPNTDHAHKISQVISVKHIQHSLKMNRKRSETCRSDF